MKLALSAFALLFALAPAYAEEPSAGIGLICDTAEQAEQFIVLKNNGDNAETALKTINKDSENACGISGVAFERINTIKTLSAGGKMVEIVEIKVMAGYNGKEWVKVEPVTQYTIIPIGGDAI